MKSKQSLEIKHNGKTLVITHDDVEPALLKNPVVNNLEEGYGVHIWPFINGVAEVSWKLDKYRYEEPEPGVPGWKADCIAYAFVDQDMRILVKFQYTDFTGLKELRRQAESKL